MKKSTEAGIIAGTVLGIAAALALSSQKVRTTIKNTVSSKDKNKLNAIKDIIGDKATEGQNKAKTTKDKIASLRK